MLITQSVLMMLTLRGSVSPAGKIHNLWTVIFSSDVTLEPSVILLSILMSFSETYATCLYQHLSILLTVTFCISVLSPDSKLALTYCLK